MGRLGVAATRAHLLLAVAVGLVLAAVYLLTCSVGWTLLVAGILLGLYALTLVDIPSAPTRDGR